MSFDLGRIVEPCPHVELGVDYGGNISGCPLCEGKNWYYDFVWEDTGIRTTEDVELLENLTQKAVMTKQDESVFHPEYGTRLSTYIGIAESPPALHLMVEQEVAKAVAGVHSRQKQQLAIGQTLTDHERIAMVESVSVQHVDVRTVLCLVGIITESGLQIVIGVS